MKWLPKSFRNPNRVEYRREDGKFVIRKSQVLMEKPYAVYPSRHPSYSTSAIAVGRYATLDDAIAAHSE
jgi:hypothetical protein